MSHYTCSESSRVSALLTVMGERQLSNWNGVASGTTAAILANVLVYPLDMYDSIVISPQLYLIYSAV